MQKLIFTIFSVIFIASTVLLVFSLPQCGHEGFNLGPVMNTTGKASCGGNMYDQHLLFLQTIFLAKLEWILFLIILLSVISTVAVVYKKVSSAFDENFDRRLKHLFYRSSKPFNYLAPQFGGRIFQKLHE